MFVVPVIQTIIFGYAIETQIENIPTVVYDLDGRRRARAGRGVREHAHVRRRRARARRRVVPARPTSGRAKVGIAIPPDYTDRLVRGEQAQVQVLDRRQRLAGGDDALNAAQLLGIARVAGDRPCRCRGAAAGAAPRREGRGRLPIEMRPRLLYNPDLESSHFFVPGLVGIILQLVTLFLTSFAIVRERELGTLEQLFVTPVGRAGLLLGKLVPYA